MQIEKFRTSFTFNLIAREGKVCKRPINNASSPSKTFGGVLLDQADFKHPIPA